MKIESCPLVFVYIQNKQNQIISYFKYKVVEILESNGEPMTVKMNPEPSQKPVVPNYKSGVLKLSLKIRKKSSLKEQILSSNFAMNIQKIKPQKLIVNIYQATELIGADSDGLSDPYFQLYHYGQMYKSEPVKNNLSPIFCKRVVFILENWKDLEAPPVVLILWDKNSSKLKRDDFIGMSIINLSRNATQRKKIEPK